MPIHDWTRVQAGLFHEFHQSWSVRLKDALNAGLLPEGFYALVEQRVDGPEPDVIAVEASLGPSPRTGCLTATLDAPRTRLTSRTPSDAARYASRANRIAIRHPLGDVVAIVEIVSPGNKDTRHAIRAFTEKVAAFLRAGVHLLVIDLFPPTPRDPQGIHPAIWEHFCDEPYSPPEGKTLTLVSYQASDDWVAHIEPVAVGDALRDMPLFLAPHAHILAPLEATYAATWAACPAPIRERVTGGA